MSELTENLRSASDLHKGTDLGRLLQWAALHIESQDDALTEVREEHAEEERERLRLERALYDATTAVAGALAILRAPACPPIEFGRDHAPHINLMAGHGDPDYLRNNGNSIRHVDCRSTKTRAQKPKKWQPARVGGTP